MTARQKETLENLAYFTDQGIKHDWHRKWARPLDVGGGNGSHHGATLAKLAEMGLAERQFNGGYQRKNYVYRISEEGRKAISEQPSPQTA